MHKIQVRSSFKLLQKSIEGLAWHVHLMKLLILYSSISEKQIREYQSMNWLIKFKKETSKLNVNKIFWCEVIHVCQLCCRLINLLSESIIVWKRFAQNNFITMPIKISKNVKNHVVIWNLQPTGKDKIKTTIIHTELQNFNKTIQIKCIIAKQYKWYYLLLDNSVNETPVISSSAKIVWNNGAAPRHLGNKEGCMLTAPLNGSDDISWRMLIIDIILPTFWNISNKTLSTAIIIKKMQWKLWAI